VAETPATALAGGGAYLFRVTSKLVRTCGMALVLAAVACTNRSRPPVHNVTITLWHCGFEPLSFDGQQWLPKPGPGRFDETNRPTSWVGRGTVTRKSNTELLYVDRSGVKVPMAPDDGVRGVCA
jgi:hypothetical protein